MSREIILSEAISRIITTKLENENFGIFIEGIAFTFDKKNLVELLNENNRELRLSILGHENDTHDLSTDNILYNNSTQKALKWRNNNDKTDIVLFCGGNSTAVASLRDAYPNLNTEIELKKALCNILLEFDNASNRKYFYDNLPAKVHLDALLDFANSIYDYRNDIAKLNEIESKNLWYLNLLPDYELFASSDNLFFKRFRLNTTYTKIIANLSDKKKQDVFEIANGNHPMLSENTNSDELVEGANNILNYESSVINNHPYSQRERLKDLSHDLVKRILNIKLPSEPKTTKKQIIADQSIVTLIEYDNLDLLEDFYSDVMHSNLEVEDNDSAKFKIGQVTYSKKLRDGTNLIEKLIHQYCNNENFGAIIKAKTSRDYKDCLERMDSQNFETYIFDPNFQSNPINLDTDGLYTIINELIDLSFSVENIKDHWEDLIKLRSKLVSEIDHLIDFPVLSFYMNDQLINDAEEYINAHNKLLELLNNIETDDIAMKKRILQLAKNMDVIFFNTKNEFVAIISPLHPYHLWRWISLTKILKIDKTEIQNIGLDYFKNLINNLPNSNPQLYIDEKVSDQFVEKKRILECSESIGSLPVYKDVNTFFVNHVDDKIIFNYLNIFTKLIEHSSLGLKISMIDPPPYAKFLTKLLELNSVMQKDVKVPLHFKIYRTRRKTELLDEDDRQLEELSIKIEKKSGSLNEIDEEMNIDRVSSEIENDKPHFIMIFEPGQATIEKQSISVSAKLTPFFIPKTYKYHRTRGTFTSHVHGSLMNFEIHDKVNGFLQDTNTNEIFNRRSGSLSSQSSKYLSQLTKNSMWMLIVEQNHPTEFLLENASRINWNFDNNTDYVAYTQKPETIDDLMENILIQSDLKNEPTTIKWFRNTLLQLSPESILSIKFSSDINKKIEVNEARGLVGLARASEWYASKYAGSLQISLDETATRRWFNRNDTNDSRGDLIAIREDDNHNPIFSIIEVKASNDVNQAKKQIDSSCQNIKILFEDTDIVEESKKLLDQARFSCLQDQFYRNLASRLDLSKNQKGDLDRLLQKVFVDKKFTWEHKIILVNIQSGFNEFSEDIITDITNDNNEVDIIKIIASEKYIIDDLNDEVDTDVNIEDEITLIDEVLSEDISSTDKSDKNEITENEMTQNKDKKIQYDDSKMLLGHALSDNKEIYWDPSQDKSNALLNFGMLITGDPGAGKTQVLRSIINEMSKRDFPILIFDFKNDYVKNNDEDETSTFIELNRLRHFNVYRKGLPFNILELVPDNNEVHPIAQIREMSLIIKRIYGLGPQQEARLESAIKKAYINCGIEVDKFIDFDEIQKTPKFQDVWDILMEDEKINIELTQRLQNLKDLINRGDGVNQTQSFDELMEDRVVFDLHELEEEDKATIAELTILRFQAHMIKGKQPRKLRRLLVIDEAMRVSKSKKLERLARDGRSFGVCLAIGTQFPKDLPVEITSNLATKIFLKNSQDLHKKTVIQELCGTNSGIEAKRLRESLDRFLKFDAFIKNDIYQPTRFRIHPYFERIKKNEN